MIFVKINETLYPASISGKMSDRDWDNRESKSITIEGDFEAVNTLFQDGIAWSIVNKESVPVLDEEGNSIFDENGNPTYEIKETEFDNSEYNIRGDLTVHTDGTCTVKMGKETDLESAYTMLYGGM